MSLEGISEHAEASVSTHGDDRNPEPVWSRTKLIAFRFAFTFTVISTFILIESTSDFVPFKKVSGPMQMAFHQWDRLHFGATVSIGAAIIRTLTGGSANVHDLVLGPLWGSAFGFFSDFLGLFVVVLLVVILWSLFDQHRENYIRLNRYLRVHVRYAVAVPMLVYALHKVFPNQFGFLTPGELLRPIGQLTHWGILWDFMAASPGYTVFAGIVELLGATLLFFRRTTLLGGLVLAGGLTNVLAMDFGYCVAPVHYAGLLLLLDLIVLTPYLPGLSAILLGQGQSKLPFEPVPRRQHWCYSGFAKAVLLWVLLIPLAIGEVQSRRAMFGAGHQVWGLFDVTTFVRTGQTIKPLANDGSTWKRVASDGPFDSGELTVEFADGGLRRFHLSEDVALRAWTISERNSKPAAKLNYVVEPDGDVALDGNIGSDDVHLLLHPVDMNKAFPLLSK